MTQPLNTQSSGQSLCESDRSILHSYASDALPVAHSARHIGIVTETYPPEINGVALTLERIANGLRKRGIVVSIVRPRQRVVDGHHRASNSKGILVRSLPLPGYKGLRVGLPATAKLCRRWRRHRPDVIYIATEGPLGLSAVRAAKRLGIPVFSGFHTNFHSYMEHYHAAWLNGGILRYLRWFHNRTAGTIVACEDLKQQLLTVGINHVHVLGRGVDCDKFSPCHRSGELRRTWGAGPKDPVILCVGRVAAEKNLSLAITAFNDIKQRSHNARMVIVGDGPLRSVLQKQEPNIIFAGVRTGQDLAAHYASADIFLFPSETETFGNVTLEAMASGLAVLAYDYAAAQEHIRNGINGLLVPYGNGHAFLTAALRLAVNPLLLRRLKSGARATAQTLDWEQIVARFDRILKTGSSEGYVPASYLGRTADEVNDLGILSTHPELR